MRRRGLLGLALAAWLASGAWAQVVELTAMTYNIRSAAGNGNVSVFGQELPHLVTRPRSMPNLIGEVVGAFGVDVLGLQEVQGRSLRSWGVDQAKRIASRLDMDHSFGTTRRGLGSLADKTGNAVLSTGEHLETERLDLGEGRQATWAVVDQPGFPEGLLVVDTHLHTGRDNGALRRRQLEELLAALEPYRLPTILLGDFNATPESDEIQALVAGELGRPFLDAWVAGGGEGEGFTAPALEPRHRIDYVFVSPDFHVASVEVVRGAAPLSDHLPLVATLRWEPSGRPELDPPALPVRLPPGEVGGLLGFGD